MVVGFMDALGLKQVELGGWSMGGWIVEIVAAEHPERVSRLMLFDAAGLNEKPDWNTDLFTPSTAAAAGRAGCAADAASAAGSGVCGARHRAHCREGRLGGQAGDGGDADGAAM